MRTPTSAFEWTRVGHAAEASCARCQGTLDLSQPDPERPERLLGTCPECGTWYLIDVEAGLMLALPEVRAPGGRSVREAN